MEKRIAFVGLFPFQQHTLSQGLEAAGFAVHWVVRWRSEAVFLRDAGVPEERILDTSEIDGWRGDADAPGPRAAARAPAPAPPPARRWPERCRRPAA